MSDSAPPVSAAVRSCRDVVAVDIGGTHARFARAQVGTHGVTMDPPVTLRTSDYPDLKSAWSDYAAMQAQAGAAPLPGAAGIAVAAPVTDAPIKLTNNRWIIDPARLADDLGLSDHVLLNDFAAVGHAVAVLSTGGADQLLPLCGPDVPLPEHGVISIVGPGTGLGVAQLFRMPGAPPQVLATEGGHIGFAPADAVDDAVVANLRARHRRVSVERVVAGPGLAAIYRALAPEAEVPDDRTLWGRALAGEDAVALAALDHFCQALGRAAGDLALAHGAVGVVIAGGLGLRLRDCLASSTFAEGFCHKGRYHAMMAALPVRLLVHDQPGLLGAAATFAVHHPVQG